MCVRGYGVARSRLWCPKAAIGICQRGICQITSLSRPDAVGEALVETADKDDGGDATSALPSNGEGEGGDSSLNQARLGSEAVGPLWRSSSAAADGPGDDRPHSDGLLDSAQIRPTPIPGKARVSGVIDQAKLAQLGQWKSNYSEARHIQRLFYLALKDHRNNITRHQWNEFQAAPMWYKFHILSSKYEIKMLLTFYTQQFLERQLRIILMAGILLSQGAWEGFFPDPRLFKGSETSIDGNSSSEIAMGSRITRSSPSNTVADSPPPQPQHDGQRLKQASRKVANHEAASPSREARTSLESNSTRNSGDAKKGGTGPEAAIASLQDQLVQVFQSTLPQMTRWLRKKAKRLQDKVSLVVEMLQNNQLHPLLVEFCLKNGTEKVASAIAASLEQHGPGEISAKTSHLNSVVPGSAAAIPDTDLSEPQEPAEDSKTGGLEREIAIETGCDRDSEPKSGQIEDIEPGWKSSRLPFSCQLATVQKLQDILENVCYDFTKRVRPDILDEMGYHHPQAAPLHRWLNLLETRLKPGDLPSDAVKAEPYILGNRVRYPLTIIRHCAAHRLSLRVFAHRALFNAALYFTSHLDDHKRHLQIQKLREAYTQFAKQTFARQILLQQQQQLAAGNGRISIWEAQTQLKELMLTPHPRDSEDPILQHYSAMMQEFVRTGSDMHLLRPLKLRGDSKMAGSLLRGVQRRTTDEAQSPEATSKGEKSPRRTGHGSVSGKSKKPEPERTVE